MELIVTGLVILAFIGPSIVVLGFAVWKLIADRFSKGR